MKNIIQPQINQQMLEEFISAINTCLKNPVSFIKARLVTIYLTSLELLYILYK